MQGTRLCLDSALQPLLAQKWWGGLLGMGGKLCAGVGQEGRGTAGGEERYCCWLRGIAGAEVACTCSEGSGAGTVGNLLGTYQTMPVGSFFTPFLSSVCLLALQWVLVYFLGLLQNPIPSVFGALCEVQLV